MDFDLDIWCDDDKVKVKGEKIDFVALELTEHGTILCVKLAWMDIILSMCSTSSLRS